MKIVWFCIICLLLYAGVNVLITQHDSTYLGFDVELNTFSSLVISAIYFYGAYTIWNELFS